MKECFGLHRVLRHPREEQKPMSCCWKTQGEFEKLKVRVAGVQRAEGECSGIGKGPGSLRKDFGLYSEGNKK